MSREDKLWHLSKHLGTRRSVLFCAWLVSMQDIKHWQAPVCLSVLLLSHAIGEWLLDKEREKEAKKPEDNL
jgi:hypothetical protein